MRVTMKDLESNLGHPEVLLFLIQEAEKEGMSFNTEAGLKFVRYAVNEDLALEEAFQEFNKEQGECDGDN